MRIDICESSLIALYNKGQVGLINFEFRRLFDAFEQLALQKANLAAENERLRNVIGADAIDREHGMCCDASSQVERLRKAGDAMLGDYKETGVIFPPSEAAWLAAKEGRDAK